MTRPQSRQKTVVSLLRFLPFICLKTCCCFFCKVFNAAEEWGNVHLSQQRLTHTRQSALCPSMFDPKVQFVWLVRLLSGGSFLSSGTVGRGRLQPATLGGIAWHVQETTYEISWKKILGKICDYLLDSGQQMKKDQNKKMRVQYLKVRGALLRTGSELFFCPYSIPSLIPFASSQIVELSRIPFCGLQSLTKINEQNKIISMYWPILINSVN